MNTNKTKLIKVTSRGLVMTSRGICRSPLGQYREKVENILVMITKNKATVVEVLPDGKEIPLTIQNFDKDNTGVEVVTETIKEPVKPAELKKVEEPKKEEPQQPAQEDNSNKQLSRKERKRLEYEKRNAEKKEEVKAEETVEAVNEGNDASPVETETTEVPAEAIEE